MPLTPEQLRAMVVARVSPREMEALNGGALTAEQQHVVVTARGIAKIKRATERKAPDSVADRLARLRAKRHAVERPPPEDATRRAEMEADPAAWLRHYLPGHYDLEWGAPHLAMIGAGLRAMEGGGSLIVLAPRGTGKTRVLWGLTLFAAITGRQAFPAFCGLTHRAAREGFRGWVNVLRESPTLAADYPEVVAPFQRSRSANGLRHLYWADTGEECGADMRMQDSVILLPGATVGLCALSLQASPRGFHVASKDGVLRPTVLLLDDPQDGDRAASPDYVTAQLQMFRADLLSLSGPGTRISTLVAATVIARDDVADRLAADPEFSAIRVGQVERWPDGWDDPDSPPRQVWGDWNAARLDGLRDEDGGQRARDHYEAHRAALNAGFAVTWAERYDRERGDPDALFAALWDYYRLGHDAFMAERQNAPVVRGATVYDLTPELIAEKQSDRPALSMPEWATVTVASTDINHYGLHTVVVAYGQDQTAAVVWYHCYDGVAHAGIVPVNATEQDRRRLIYEALVGHGRQLAELGLRIDTWAIDGGYEMQTVGRYAGSAATPPGLPVVMARGYSADRYRPNAKGLIGQPREGCHLTQWQQGRGLAWNADYWREIAQRAWLGSVDAPGSVSLFAGRHDDIAEQICREKLVEVIDGKSGRIWRWNTAPGRHDYGDAMAQGYAVAAYHGISANAKSQARKAKPRKRKRRTLKT